jgi:hypothetical protein
MLLSPLISKIVRMVKDTKLHQMRSSTAPGQIRKRHLLTFIAFESSSQRNLIATWTSFLCTRKGSGGILSVTAQKRLVVLAGFFGDFRHFSPVKVAASGAACRWYGCHSLFKARP